MEKIYYGLKLKDKDEILGYIVESTDGDEFCNNTAYTLCDWEEQEWLVETYDKALYVQYNSTKYYCAGHDTPTHNFKPEQLEIVKITKIITYEIPKHPIIKKVKIKSDYNNKHIELKSKTSIDNNYDGSMFSFNQIKLAIFFVTDYDEKYYRILNTKNADISYFEFLYINKKYVETVN